MPSRASATASFAPLPPGLATKWPCVSVTMWPARGHFCPVTACRSMFRLPKTRQRCASDASDSRRRLACPRYTLWIAVAASPALSSAAGGRRRRTAASASWSASAGSAANRGSSRAGSAASACCTSSRSAALAAVAGLRVTDESARSERRFLESELSGEEGAGSVDMRRGRSAPMGGAFLGIVLESDVSQPRTENCVAVQSGAV